jgi:hypothetical protein
VRDNRNLMAIDTLFGIQVNNNIFVFPLLGRLSIDFCPYNFVRDMN